MIKLAAVLLGGFFVLPAFAQDACPNLGAGSLTADDLVKQAAANGDTLADNVAIKAGLFDHIVVDVDTNGVWLWFIGGDCVVGKPMFMGPLPSAAGPPKPKLQGSGLEIGA